MAMDGAEHDFLTDAGLAGDHHRRIRLRDPTRQIEHPAADRIDRHHIVFQRRRRRRQPAVDTRHQHFGLEGLDQIIGRAITQCADRALDRFVGGHQHHRQITVAAADLTQQGVAIHRLHLDVADHEVVLRGGQRLQRGATVGRAGRG